MTSEMKSLFFPKLRWFDSHTQSVGRFLRRDKSCGYCYGPHCKSVWWRPHAGLQITCCSISPCSITSQSLRATVNYTPDTGCLNHCKWLFVCVKDTLLVKVQHGSLQSGRYHPLCCSGSVGPLGGGTTSSWETQMEGDFQWFSAEVTLCYLYTGAFTVSVLWSPSYTV